MSMENGTLIGIAREPKTVTNDFRKESEQPN
jgi:hypothetical protein